MAALDPSAPICRCGVRGCELIDLHGAAYVELLPDFRKGARRARRHKRRR